MEKKRDPEFDFVVNWGELGTMGGLVILQNRALGTTILPVLYKIGPQAKTIPTTKSKSCHYK